MSNRIQHLSQATLLLAGLIAFAGPAEAFGTVNLLGQRAEHEKITRLGLSSFGLGPKTLSDIAGKTGSFGAVGAPDQPARGLMGRPEAHCDGADAFAGRAGYPRTAADAASRLTACRAYIVRNLQEAVRSAGDLVSSSGSVNSSEVPTIVSCVFNGKKGRAKCNVLEGMGLALHAAQDFYSHSNWTDNPSSGDLSLTNPPGLGHAGRAPWLDPRRTEGFPDGLISGCYEGFPESQHCQGRIRHADLNKDKGNIDAGSGKVGTPGTPRGKIGGNFERAVKAAVEDTRDKWAYFESRVLATYGEKRGRVIVCVMRNDDPGSCR